MNRYFWFSFFAILLCLGGATWALSSVTRYKPLNPKGVPQDMPHEEVVKLAQEMRRPTVRPLSSAQLESTVHDFGMCDPGMIGAHTFMIRNTGTEVLSLGIPHESCKCGEAEVLLREIPPGEQGGVKVTWDPGPEERQLDITVTVPTSDPDHEELLLEVRGTVRQRVYASPNRLSFTSVVSDSRSTQEVLLLSHVWDSFTLQEINSTISGVTWEVVPVSAETLTEEEALAGYVLRVTLPLGMPGGFFEGAIHFSAVPADSKSAAQSYSVPMEGRVQRLMSIYGNEINPEGLIDFGTIQRGEQKQARLIVKVRDRNPQLTNIRFEIDPPCVVATLVPQAAGVPGSYVLEITVPAESLPCTHLREDQYGTLRILTDHPRLAEQVLPLRLAVTARESPLP